MDTSAPAGRLGKALRRSIELTGKDENRSAA
jgi:hypothetical protein